MIKKGFVVIIIVLFIGMSLIPLADGLSLERNVLIENPVQDSELDDDTTPPIIEVTYEVSGNPIDGWIVLFTAEAYDEESGIDRVEMWINDEIIETIKGPGPCYTFPINWCKELTKSVFTFIAYNGAGLSSFDSIAGTDIKIYKSSQPEGVDTIETTNYEKLEGPGWKWFLFGHITDIEIFEFENWTLMNATALHVRGIVWNILRNYPNIPLPINWIGEKFCIPYKLVKIILPTLTGHNFLIAFGTMEI